MKSEDQSVGSESSTQTLRQHVQGLLNANASDATSPPSGELWKLIREWEARQAELERENRELRKALEASVPSNDSSAMFYDFAPISLLSLDSQGGILHANLTAATMFGLERSELLGANLSSFVTCEFQDAWSRHHQSVFDGPRRQACELEIRKPDGTTVFAHLESVRLEMGNNASCVSALVDISDRRKVEEKLGLLNEDLGNQVTEQNEKIRLMAEAVSHLGEGVLITSNQLEWPGPRIEFVNEAMCRISGYRAEELLGQTPRLLQGEKTEAETLARIRTELSAGRSCVAELVNYCKDGSPYEAELFITPMYNTEGHRTNFVSIQRDITERKRSEKRVRESEARFRALANATFDVTFRMNADWSELRMLDGRGFVVDTKGPATGWVERYIPAADRQWFLNTIQQAIIGKSEFDFEHPVIRVDGTIGWAHSRAVPILEPNGEIAEWFGAAIDITPRKNSEKAIRQRDHFLRMFVESVPAAVAMFDRKFRYIFASRRWRQVFQLTGRDIVGQSHFELFPHLPDHWQANFRRVFAGEVIEIDEETFVQLDGKQEIVRWEMRPWQKENDGIGGAILFCEVITESKLAEAKLREREELLASILDSASDAIVNIDQRGRITQINSATEKMFGYAAEELVGQNVKILMPGPHREEHDQYLRNFQQTGLSRIIGVGREVMALRKDGSRFPVSLSVSEVRQLGWYTGILRDISQLRDLQHEVLSVVEEEQRRIGQDLHDSTQQELAGLGMLARTLFKKLSSEKGGLSEEARRSCGDLAHKILDGIHRTHRDLQSISRGLATHQLEHGGLVPALRDLVARIDALEGVTCDFHCDLPGNRIDGSTAIQLYRVAQEALTNALKHAEPKQLRVSLVEDDGECLLQIADDGKGFHHDREQPGMGLKTMYYRSSLIGAGLTISPIQTGGTLVSCRLFGGGANES